MKKIMSIMMIWAMVLLLPSCQGTAPVLDIEWAQSAKSHERIPVRFALTDADAAQLGQTMPLYRVVPCNGKEGRDAYQTRLLTVFFGDDRQARQEGSFTRFAHYVGDNGKLNLYDNGCYSFFRDGGSRAPVPYTDEEVVEKAAQFLRENGLLPDGFEPGRKLGGEATVSDEGSVMTSRSVGFYHKIDGYDLYGRSDVSVEIDAEGIKRVTGIYSDYAYDRDVECLSYKEVQALDPVDVGQILYNAEELADRPDHITLTGVKVMYYDAPVTQPELTHIQPIYQFSGVIEDARGNAAEYYWTIPALREAYDAT
ncbi:MAG: hypothetical protein ACOYJY_06095 [Acutalibacteraceae bacterium]|jgi:hypothetical protein